jgi:putative ABC transport system permease protein
VRRLRVKMRRDLWHMRWRALAIVLTIASGVAIYAGIYTGLLSLFWTRDSIFAEQHFADLQVSFLPDDARNLPDLGGIPGVARVERRLLFPGTVRIPGRRPLAALMTFLENPAPGVHAFKVVEGRLVAPDEFDTAVIDIWLARYHGKRIGDEIEVKVGEATYRRRVVGIVITPEYFVSTSSPAYFIPEKGSIGFVFANLGAIADTLGFTMVNDLVFLYERGADPAAVKARVLARVAKLNVQQVLSRERHFAYRYIQSQLEGVRAFAPAIVLVLLTLTFIVIAVNVGRMIAADRPQIGALMALGYQPGRLLAAYLEATLILALAGGAIGLAGAFLVRDIFATVSASSMGMPELRTLVDAPTLARALAWQLAVALVATAIPVIRLVRRVPQAVIRPARRPVVHLRMASIHGIAGAIRQLPSGYRYAVRNLARQPVRSAVTLASIALALGVATAYRLSVGSLDTTLSGWLANDKWDLAVDFLHPVELDRIDELKALPSVKQAEPYFSCYVELRAGDRVEDATVLGLVPGSQLSMLMMAEGRRFRESRRFRAGAEREAVLSRDLSQRLNLSVGQVFEAHTMNEHFPVRLVGLSWAAVGALTLMPFPVAEEICQFPGKASGAYVDTRVDTDTGSALYDVDFVAKVLAKRDLLTQVRQVLSVMIVVLDMATGVSVVVGMMVILTSVNLSVLENDRDFGTLRALGYSRGLISTIVLTEAIVYAVGAVLLSIPIAVGTSVYLNAKMSAAWIQVHSSFLPSAFAGVLLPALVLIPLGCLPSLRHVLNRDALTAARARSLE